MAAGTAAGAAGAAPGFAFSQQTHLSLSESFRVMQSEHSHLADCWATRALNPVSVGGGADLLAVTGAAAAPNEKLLLGASGLEPGLGVSQATHLVLSGSFRTIQASHSHLLEPVSLKALPNPEVVVPLPTGAAVVDLPRTSKQLPDFSSGTTTGLLFRASRQLPLFSGSGAFFRADVGLVCIAGVTAFGLAISGSNWKLPSLRDGAGVELLLLLPAVPNGSGLLNLKLFCDLEVTLVVDPTGVASFVGDENLYTLLLFALTTVSVGLGATGFGFSLLSEEFPVVAIGNLMSNLGTDFNPASCTSGNLTCGTGAFWPRSAWDSSRIRCSLLRILLVCFTLLFVSSDSALVGSLYWVGSLSTVLPLDSVAIRRADSVLVWRRFI